MEKWDRNWGCRVEIDGKSRGWEIAVIQSAKLRVSILVGKGCDVVEVLYKPTDLDLTPRTGRGLRRRDEAIAAPWSEMGSFLDQYEGGWQEIIPHGGQPGDFQGARFAQHGESSRLPWTVCITENTPERVEILCTSRLSIMPFYIEKRFSLTNDDAILKMETTVKNEGAVELPLMAGHHLAFGSPFVGPGSIISMPEGTTYSAHEATVFETGRRSNGVSGTWPEMISDAGKQIDMRELPPSGTKSDLHYLKPPEGWYTISSKDSSIVAKVEWNLEAQPYLWFWQEFGGGKTYPWWGMEYLVGLEPWTSSPGTGLSDAVAASTAHLLRPGETFSNELSVQISEGKMK
jgi:galactose mutarotase-like enzyme